MTSASERRAIFLEEIGVGPAWALRGAAAAGSPAAGSPAAESSDRTIEIGSMDWMQLSAAVAGCTKCNLCQNRTQTVFGVGDQKAKWLFIGEGPGHDEDLHGEPFVGQAGKLLDNMLVAMGLKRGENTYIANIVKCRPTDADGDNRPPAPEEAAACMPYLQRQIALIRPEIIVALGKTAALSLLQLDPDTPVSTLRGKVHRYGELPLVVTYHPAYLLQNLSDKKKTWADLCLAMTTYGKDD
jgi:uracil-DNA glycosylase family 4